MPDMPDPIPNDLPAVWGIVVEEMKTRDQVGLERYKTHLQPFNSRPVRRDIQEELLDALVYNKQAEIEWDWTVGKLQELYLEVVYPIAGLTSDDILQQKVVPILMELKHRLRLPDFDFENGDAHE